MNTELQSTEHFAAPTEEQVPPIPPRSPARPQRAITPTGSSPPHLSMSEELQSEGFLHPPAQPPRPRSPQSAHLPATDVKHTSFSEDLNLYDSPAPPPQPPRPQQMVFVAPRKQSASPVSGQSDTKDHGGLYAPPPPPRRLGHDFGDDDPGNPIHFTRDPHKLIAYLVPFPQPQLKDVDPATIPPRFLIYTPPPPPLSKPAEGAKEAKLTKVQRKWQEEVRSAKTSTAKTASWQGVKSKATRGISKAMNYTTTSNLDFLGRVSGHKSDSEDESARGGRLQEGETTHKTVGVEEMILIYPPSMNMDQQQMREEFVNTMLRTKTKAQRDAIISTGLMPVAYGIDILATLVWPFGGLGEIDTVWAYANIRGAKTARSVTKRLSSSSDTGNHEQDTLHLNFSASHRIEILRRYLAAECHKTDPKLFPSYTSSPTESDVLEAIGWSPKQSAGETKNWEDEQWEVQEVKDDLQVVMHKGSKEWKKWCTAYGKDPVKAMKK